ncbi:MAG: hypothetical protein CVU95_00920 [Firmicutes bacterium HGW-Firmicutes-2]|jgi:hypothetical protein|nr:MAG: hypothetical protein CVU95_00920 [Firmicutes bacterium HGW-Firmicutes-2]
MIYATSQELSEELLELASSKVDELTFNRIVEIGFDNLSDFQKDKVIKATLAQAQHYEDYGTDVASLSGFNVSGLSMSFKDNGPVPTGVSPVAYSHLTQSGLMYRGWF